MADRNSNVKRAPAPTRRDFVKSAALGAAAAATVGFPTIVPSSALGNADKPAPSNRLTMGFIGIGKMSSGHLDRYSGRPDVQVLAVCDVDTTRREHAKKVVEDKYAKLERKDYKGCDAYVDFRELLARKDIDAVVIGTPDHWHTIPLIEACKAKKDIYCEKPLTLTIAEAKASVDAVRKYERVLQTGSQQRSEGPFREACEYVRSGRLGKIKEVHVALGGSFSVPCNLPAETPDPGLDWDRWLGQTPVRPYNQVLCRKGLPNNYPFNPGWRDYREYSGGYVTDWGAHHFDITQWALDMDGAGPVEVHPPEKQGDKYGARLVYRGSPVGDEITVTHKEVAFEGEVAKPDGQKEKLREGNGILFIGEKGRLFVNRGRMFTDPDSVMKEKLTDKDVKLFKSPGHHENWLNCIKTRERPIADVEVGARSVTVCHLVNLAYWNHRSFKWDPKAWEFPGDEAANQLRDRPRRDPWQLPPV